MAKKKTLLLITEGTSDANALAAPLQNLLSTVIFGDSKSDVTLRQHVCSPKISRRSMVLSLAGMFELLLIDLWMSI